MIELARMGVVPFCPKCGGAALFAGRPRDYSGVDTLVPTQCASIECGWSGVSRRTVPQPKIVLSVTDPRAPEAEPPQ